jgi:hypothetical protein
VYYIIYRNVAIPLFHLFEKETRNTASRVSTLEQDYQAKYDLTQYGNSLGYTQFHIVDQRNCIC